MNASNEIKIMLYTTKVWLTAVFIAPMLYILMENLILLPSVTRNSLQLIPGIYQFAVYFEIIFSLITWLIFSIAVGYIVQHVSEVARWRKLITLSGVLLTVLTFALSGYTLLGFDHMVLLFGGGNCLCIAAGCWFYKLPY